MTGPAASPKAAARKAAFARRQSAFEADREAGFAAVTAANDALLKALEVGGAGPVAGYLPIRSEMSPLPAMTRLAASREVCVPVMRGPGQGLVFHRWTPGCALVTGPFGVAVPAEAVLVQPAAMIVPLVAFDVCGVRLGYGGGFYDRTLEALRASQPVLALGLAYGAQQATDLPREQTDQLLDGLVTEDGLLKPVSGRLSGPFAP